MAQRRHHYERAFEEYLRSRRIPYVSVDEARKALMPARPIATVPGPARGRRAAANSSAQSASPSPPARSDDPALPPGAALKSFDFVIYGEGGNLLIDIKGRRVAARGRMEPSGAGGVRATPASRSRLECWVTQDDVESLTRWQSLFGEGFQSAFVFVYWCVEQPPDALFQEIFEYRGRWYALRAVTLEAYRSAMKPRSVRWRTVDIPSAAFEQVSQPFAPPMPSPLAAAPRRGQSETGVSAPGVPGFGLEPGSPAVWPLQARDEGLCSLDDPEFSADLGPQLPALHPYTAPSTPHAR